MATISRQEYNNLFGPTVGDKIRLGDTDLYVEIEKDLREYGDEVVYGGGKTIRDGMGLANTMTSEEGALDLVITNVTIIDANLGVVKADVGVKDGKIAGIGKAGNPNIMHGVHPDLVTSTATDAISGEHLILTAAGIDGHVHMISPQQAYACLSNGITTLFGGGIGPTDGSNGTTITSGRWNIERMLESIEGLPVNVGLLGKGNCSMNQPLEEQIEAGACGLKIHEDWGSTPAAIRAALGVADRFDVQVAIHSDTLNESGYVEDTIAAMDGRTIHTYHTEGAGGGHAPDLLKVASMPYVLPSSTNPTLPFGVNSQAELFDMIMVCHNLNPKIPSDVAFAESRVRPETQAAENVLHDLGILSMVSSDSQAMGRIGESFMRTFQMASFMKNACGKLAEDADGNDNFRVLRYIAKITINPAITYGVSDYLGSVEKGKVADLVLWEPQFFGAKPKMVIKGGLINWSNMGDPNASLPTPQPCYYRPMYGAFGRTLPETCLSFVSGAAFQSGIKERLHLHRMVQPVRRTRQLTKYNMVRNGGMPKIDVNPETFDVLVNDIRAYVKPADKFPLSQLLWFSFLFPGACRRGCSRKLKTNIKNESDENIYGNHRQSAGPRMGEESAGSRNRIYRSRPVDGPEKPLRGQRRPGKRIRRGIETPLADARRRYYRVSARTAPHCGHPHPAQRRAGRGPFGSGASNAGNDHPYLGGTRSCHRQPALARSGQGDKGLHSADGG